MNEIRILMVDDHSLFRESLGRLLEANPAFRLVGQCSTVTAAITTLRKTKADVVLLDFDLGEEQGFKLFSELKNYQIDVKVLMVTAGMTELATLEIMEAGASGVLLKHSGLDQLIAAIQLIANGGIWLDSAVLRAIVASKSTLVESKEDTQKLTTRQSEVIRGILDGLTNKEISQKLNSSESAVKAVIQELFRKAGVRTRSQLVRIAIEKHSSNWLKADHD